MARRKGRSPARGARPAALDPDEVLRLERLRSLGRLLDTSIPVPGTGFRFGVDALLGLLPGFGDAAGAMLSGLIVVEAARFGVPRGALLRMGANVAVETVVGAIPLLGDLFDAGWKANVRNLRLLEAHLADPGRAARATRGWAFGAAAVIVVLLAGLAAVAVGLATAVLNALT